MQTNLKSRPEEIEAHKVTVGINIEQVWKDTAREKLSRLLVDFFRAVAAAAVWTVWRVKPAPR